MGTHSFSFGKKITASSILDNLKYYEEHQHNNNHFWGKGKQGEIDLWWYDDFDHEFQILVFDMSFKEDFHFVDNQKDFDCITFRFFLETEVIYNQMKVGKGNHANVVIYNSKKSVPTKVLKDQELKGVTFRITRQFIKKLCNDRWDLISNFIENPKDWMIHESLDLEMERLLKDIIVIQKGIEGKYGLTLSRSVELMTYLLIQLFKNRANQKSIQLSDEKLVEIFKIKDLLIENLMEPPPITELSEKFGINIGVLRTNFKEVFGTSPHQFVINERLIEARRLVKFTELNMTEISDQIGYTDSSHFAKHYRRKFGISPLSDRKK
ncbi:helix-turn-helix domain-containing protein [Flammeovirga sp. SJP92]|uniref:helix-turn-helix domain-containing protein n=1 Tax=Flammeovirga sp. SJP92 TaxID=1775430 RepID=UPI000787EC1D|nr:AraC family transcriptional regulator [Flammeovirga sp. SJP92]KXX70542.1 hypothetical protein AVL50_08575 [Flammeovirga sp. SJP92]